MRIKVFYICCLSVACLTCLTMIACAVYIEFRFSKVSFSSPLKQKPQLWSHRGIGSNYPENSIEAFEQAVLKKAGGIEIDVYYQKDKKEISVTHDPPKADSSYLQLSQILSRFRDTISYWVDLKNLDQKNAPEIASKLDSLSQRFNLTEKLFVESVEAAPLNIIKSNGVKTIYWLQYNRTNPIKKYFKKLYLKKNLYTYQFDGVSTASQFYDSDFKESFVQIPTFIFHPENEERIQILKKDSNVNVILTDWEYEK